MLREHDFLPLDRTLAAVEPLIRPFLGQIKWLNFGGGHHITRADYQRDELVLFLKRIRETTGLDLYLEPGEAVALDAGILVGEILDVRSEEHTSELQPLMRISYAVFCLKKKT